MLTIRHKDTMVYKYGCCEPRFNNLGCMHLLYWKTIQDAKHLGLRSFDLGRTDADQQGLITFKNRWGATQSMLTYLRYCASEDSTHFFDIQTTQWKSKATKLVCSVIPPSLLAKVGQVMYRHIG
jgi:hypothetical protein